MNRDFKGIWIPRDIWLSNDLSTQEKVFMAEIDSLDNGPGCFASNKHFSEFFNLSKGRCSQIIATLEEKGFIKVKMQYSSDGKTVEKRFIKVVSKLTTPSKYSKGGYLENDEDRNTLLDLKEKEEETVNPFTFYQQNIGMLSPYETQTLTNYLDVDGVKEEVLILAIQQAVLNGKKNMRYIAAILNDWIKSNVTTVEQAQAKINEFSNKRKAPAKPKQRKVADF
ncbi:DnaD domain protein [Alkalihalobacillus trypoxylicola]|uniref:DnaB/C C-terminal domain-containing protein n=1 Tax=Alkalihalobacillus trypoxylicola TaxID=519424 RepID=A0A162D580_9BACI|nr:DnaD domain protein [Alkalihalobacillus trypoxylicola]KYG28147.1 hypothetical protein AZF04_09595 [Alkalihalobacillus trypoxylicola]